MFDNVFTVSELTGRIKTQLESHFPDLTVEGEISNFRPASSGHWYFSLKDEDAVIDSVMFRGMQRSIRFDPRDGEMVRVRGSVSVYPRRGRYQIICTSMEKAGEGAILALLAERKRLLAAEGLFATDKKRPLPVFPATIAVVTSPTGAAIRDIISVLNRRRAKVTVRVLPCMVQGVDAGTEIARQIDRASRLSLGEVIIVTRGGGSLEDLLAFSEEAVVRAISRSRFPVISAVGHEIDESLSDLAADVRAPTPSAAAELVSAGGDEIHRRIMDSGRAIASSYLNRISRVRHRLSRYTLDELQYRYRNYTQPWYQRLDDARARIVDGISDRTLTARRRIELAGERIAGASPFAILERGYAIIRNSADSRVIASSSSASVDQPVRIVWHDGEREARIEEKIDGEGKRS